MQIHDTQQNIIAVLSFYSFVNIVEPEILLSKTLYWGKRKYIHGTVLIAKEGFNGSISGNEESLRFLVNNITEFTGTKEVSIKINYCNVSPFHKFKVKIKPEIVALGVGNIDVENLKGEYIEPADWDQFITNEDVVTIDTRNDYEVQVGTFKNAVNPHTETFKQFPEWLKQNKESLTGKKVAMYCTGGIRCEKSTAYLKLQGFEKVYHLRGGILQYLEDTKNKSDTWQGECFVFDDRFAVDNELAPINK